MQDEDRRDRLRAIGSLLWKDPQRILDSARELHGSGVTLECRLRGASMGASIPRGARVRITPAPGPGLRVGDVVAVVDDAGLYVHRLVYRGRSRRARGFVVTQGDACYYPDPPVESTCLLGTVDEFRCDGRWRNTPNPADGERTRSALATALRLIVTGAMELDPRIARAVARALRIRKETPARAAADP